MKKFILITIAIATATLLFTGSSSAAKKKNGESQANLSPEQMEANYTKAIEGRTAKILGALALSDANKAAKVHDIVIAQWRALRAWHDANDPKLKAAAKSNPEQAAQIRASLKSLHNEFLAKLATQLTPAQIETVKDEMTYNKVRVTYDAYCEIIPTLTDAQKAKVMELLKEAREEAMDCGSAGEKSAVFKRYKGKINNYFVSQGVDERKARKEWSEKQKQAAPGQPAR